MKKIGLGLDYNNICKDYNTVYLDRDNDDPQTTACMKKVLQWFEILLSDFLEHFNYEIYRMNQNTSVPLSEIVKKRFFFYSLEKEIISQTFILQENAVTYVSLEEWAEKSDNSLVIQNDEEGEGVYFYLCEGSSIHTWLLEKLKDCSIDDVPLENV